MTRHCPVHLASPFSVKLGMTRPTQHSILRSKEQDTFKISKWQDLMDASRYRALLSQGEKALQRNDVNAAFNAYHEKLVAPKRVKLNR